MYPEFRNHDPSYLSATDRLRLAQAGTVVAQLYDRAKRLFRYVLPDGKVFAWERLEDDTVVLRE